jgi:nucleoside diphosphate kinase
VAKELAFAMLNPYTLAKSRTGGVIARYIGRTNLRLAAARMFGPSRELAERYAEHVRTADPEHPELCRLIADYIAREYTPDPATGRPSRVLLLLFEGEDAIRKVWETTGSATLGWGCGQTIRETYGDYITDDDGGVKYFEPAVLAAPTAERDGATLRLWAQYAETDGGIIETPRDLADDHVRTLVMLKPDNFRTPSLRAGHIIDILSSSGLRIIGAKKFSMSIAQAEEFYGPVREALRSKFPSIGCERLKESILRQFGFSVSDEIAKEMCEKVGVEFANHEFENIVQFMTGHKPSECDAGRREEGGTESCLALVYAGPDAVARIREILGPTDPKKAQPGSVRGEFGSSIMVNAAHASDSPENAERELRIIDVEEDTIAPLVEKYYGK